MHNFIIIKKNKSKVITRLGLNPH